MKQLFITFIVLLFSLNLYCQTIQTTERSELTSSFAIKDMRVMDNKIVLKSSSFQEGGMIPKMFTCQGEDISPQLSWDNIPSGTKTFALICDDPDAASGNFVHWVIFNIPSYTKTLNEGVLNQKQLPDNTKQGVNDFGRIGYGGPCPPALHRYYFKIYALNAELKLDAGESKKDLLKAMEGHIIAQGQLMGKFEKK